MLIPYTWNIELFPFVLNCKSGMHVETFHLWCIHLHSWYNEHLIIVQWTPSFVKNEDVQISIMRFEIRVPWLKFDSVRGLYHMVFWNRGQIIIWYSAHAVNFSGILMSYDAWSSMAKIWIGFYLEIHLRCIILYSPIYLSRCNIVNANTTHRLVFT